MKRERKVWAISLIALWWLAPNQTSAQQEQDSVRTLNEVVVVTATKFPKNQTETGKVVTVIDEATLSRSAGKDLSQLLNEQVGLFVNGANSNTGKDKSVFLRGASTQYTLILLDGIPVTDPSGIGGAFDLRMLPIDQIKRIEILKGSQSTLYGTDAIAGVINIITKDKGDKPFGASAMASYGTYHTSKANVGASGSTTIFDYNVSYTRFKTDGISEALDDKETGTFDKDGYSQNAIQANFSVRPIKTLSLRPFVRFSDFDGKYDGGSFADDPINKYNAKVLNYGLTGQLSFATGSFNAQYSHAKSERLFHQLDYNNDPITYSYYGDFDNAEVYVQNNFGENFQVLAGVNYQLHSMKDANATEKDPSINIVSPYASFFVKNVGGFSAEVGARYNKHSTFGNAFTYNLNPSYLINNRIKVFVNYTTGFKAPTLNELYGQWGSNKNLKAQESSSPEAGVQYIGVNNKFDIRATVFSRQIKNVITYGADGYENLNEQNDKGFEIEPTVKLDNGLTIKAYYAFVDGDVTTKTFADKDTTYFNLLKRPKHSVGINVGYLFSKAFYVSVNYKTYSNRKDNFYDAANFSNSIVSLDAYQLLDVYAEYAMLDGHIKLFADAKNILNQKYVEVYGYSTMRFNINAGVTFRL